MTGTISEDLLTSNGVGSFDPITRVAHHLIDFVRWRFSLLPAGAYRWDPASELIDSQKSSEILIMYEGPVDAAKAGARPAITAAIGQSSFQGVGLNDRTHVDWATGAQTRMDLIPTMLRLHFLSTMPVEARRLAFFATNEIWALRDDIIVTCDDLLQIGQRPILSEPTPAGSLIAVPSVTHEWVAVTVQFPAFIQHCVTTHPMNKRILRDFRARMNLV